MSGDATASVTAALLGLDGFVVLAAADAGGEVELLVETTAELVGCPECGAVARAKDRRSTWVRDLPVGGRPVVICWHKRVWCCPQAACPVKTWTEAHPAIAPRACLTERARARAWAWAWAWAFEQVGARDAAVSAVAAQLGVAWATIMSLTIEAGTPIVEDPQRLANRITESEAGVGYVWGEGIREPLRIRAGWVPDAVIKDLETFLTHPHHHKPAVMSRPTGSQEGRAA